MKDSIKFLDLGNIKFGLSSIKMEKAEAELVWGQDKVSSSQWSPCFLQAPACECNTWGVTSRGWVTSKDGASIFSKLLRFYFNKGFPG